MPAIRENFLPRNKPAIRYIKIIIIIQEIYHTHRPQKHRHNHACINYSDVCLHTVAIGSQSGENSTKCSLSLIAVITGYFMVLYCVAALHNNIMCICFCQSLHLGSSFPVMLISIGGIHIIATIGRCRNHFHCTVDFDVDYNYVYSC